MRSLVGPVLTVLFRQFWGSAKRRELLSSVATEDHTCHYQQLTPERRNRFSLRPYRCSPEYEAWPSTIDLSGVYPFNGPVERRAMALISIDREALEDRMTKYLDPTVSNDEVRALYPSLMMTGNRIAGPEARQKILKEFKYDPSKIVKYPFKPFDFRWCYLENLRPLFSELSPELLAQSKTANVSFLITRDTADKTSEGVPFFSFETGC